MTIKIGTLLTARDTTAAYTLGTIVEEAGGKSYKYIQYDAATAAVAGVAGEVAYYVAATGYAANTVTSDLSDSDEVGAGVLQAALADGEYGWVQIEGLATLTIGLTAGADGQALTATGAGDGTLDVSGLVTDAVVAIAGDASANQIMCMFPR